MRLDMDAAPNAPPHDHPLVPGENAPGSDSRFQLNDDTDLAGTIPYLRRGMTW
jgi:hypothetical protein